MHAVEDPKLLMTLGSVNGTELQTTRQQDFLLTFLAEVDFSAAEVESY